MKRIKSYLGALATLLIGATALLSCTDYQDEIDNTNARLTALEKLAGKMNEQYSTLQTLAQTLSDGDYITDLKTVEGGYEINFKKHTAVTVRHGKDGKDGETPDISIRKDEDGHYYWTLGGEWITDGGRKIRADGEDGKDAVAPQVRINPDNNEWEISTDGGQNWRGTGVKATGKDGVDAMEIFTKVEPAADGKSVTFTLRDGTQFTVPMGKGEVFPIHHVAVVRKDAVYKGKVGQFEFPSYPEDHKQKSYQQAVGETLYFGVFPSPSYTTSPLDFDVDIEGPAVISKIVGDTKGFTVKGTDLGSATVTVTMKNPDAWGNKIVIKRNITFVDAIPFEDMNAQYVLGAIVDQDLDGMVSYEEAKKIDYLHLSKFTPHNSIVKNIIKFNELQYCTNVHKILMTPRPPVEAALVYYNSGCFSHFESLIEITLPQNLTVIGDGAFKSCKNLQTVKIPAEIPLTNIYEYAFAETPNLESVDLSNATKLEEINEAAFFKSGIPELDLSNTRITTLNNLFTYFTYAYFDEDKNVKNTTLKTLKLPATLEWFNVSHGNTALQSLEGLNDLWIYATTAPKIEKAVGVKELLKGTSNIQRLHVPQGCASQYKAWKKYVGAIIEDAN